MKKSELCARYELGQQKEKCKEQCIVCSNDNEYIDKQEKSKNHEYDTRK